MRLHCRAAKIDHPLRFEYGVSSFHDHLRDLMPVLSLERSPDRNAGRAKYSVERPDATGKPGWERPCNALAKTPLSAINAGRRVAWTCIDQPTICLFTFDATTLLLVFLLSMWTQNYLDLDRTFTMANYREAASEKLYQVLMIRSVVISVIVTMLPVTSLIPSPTTLRSLAASEKRCVLPADYHSFWTSYLIRVFLWKVILGYNGVVKRQPHRHGFIEEPLTFILYNANAVVITLAHAWPFAILPIFVSISRIDTSLLEVMARSW